VSHSVSLSTAANSEGERKNNHLLKEKNLKNSYHLKKTCFQLRQIARKRLVSHFVSLLTVANSEDERDSIESSKNLTFSEKLLVHLPKIVVRRNSTLENGKQLLLYSKKTHFFSEKTNIKGISKSDSGKFILYRTKYEISLNFCMVVYCILKELKVTTRI